MTWSITDQSFTTSTSYWGESDKPFTPTAPTPSASGFKYGSVASVPADGSASVTVLYPNPYASVTSAIMVSYGGGSSWSGYSLAIQVSNPIATGFTVTVSGGPTGFTTTVYWMAEGS
jgi:hypothetical protein